MRTEGELINEADKSKKKNEHETAVCDFKNYLQASKIRINL